MELRVSVCERETLSAEKKQKIKRQKLSTREARFLLAFFSKIVSQGQIPLNFDYPLFFI